MTLTQGGLFEGYGGLSLTRNEQLGRLGNGVVPQQAAAALRHLLEVESWTHAA